MTNAGAVFIQQVQLSENSRAWINEDTRPHKIQVLGDSISCGYGTLWDGTETEEVTVYQAGDQSFAVKLADLLNAELEVVAISGIGVGNAVNTPCPLLPHYKQEDMHNGVDCDFSRYVPEVVVIALGTNDHGQQNPIDVFVNNSVKMIRFIREQYPECMIVWTYGAMGAPYGEALEDMVAQLVEDGMKDIYYMPFVPSSEEPGGQHGHPGQLAHNRMARELAELISEKTGWPLMTEE
jgi:lysophospholipase L1-like esterase